MKKKMWRTGLCGLTACSMLFSMPALAWAADEPQNTGIEDGLIAYYDFENVNEKKVPNVKNASTYEGSYQEIMFRLKQIPFLGIL